ncbi:MAG: pantoate--beta-alanine ligase [Proteobacteria bacterium]|jgi:pantoate--beta-alanine ligase|nr:pantoate--beta-alanine ligase [Pseudomonadota bacterium]MCG6935945.1 pantoate--beta-alanine ligase [Pseudomonadota bacterium]
MQSVSSVKDMQALSREWRRKSQRTAFVPTMGNLHAGHLALVGQAAIQADRVVVSIFVNPLQFNEPTDFKNYPRTLDEDLQKLADYPVDAIFLPTEAELYPAGREATTIVEVPGLSDVLEGASRPGHFRGVTTVVAKLFNCVLPDVALFGEKDFQQLLVVRRMVADLDMPIEIVSHPTLREPDGLAMSSRNRRLNAEQRARAPVLYQVLVRSRDRIRQGEADFTVLEHQAGGDLSAAGLMPDYVAIRRAEDLADPRPGDELVIVAAARLGKTRLIDNVRV